MDARKFIDTVTLAARLKDTVRHCYTENGRRESVAEHSWLTTLMAFFLQDEFPQADMNKVITMCMIHDLGEAFTGDIPTFEKTEEDKRREKALLFAWVDSLPPLYAQKLHALYEEMEQRKTIEAKIYKAIDGLEAVIQHNNSALSTWLPLEYTLNQTYALDKTAFSEYLSQVRRLAKLDTVRKIETEGKNAEPQ